RVEVAVEHHGVAIGAVAGYDVLDAREGIGRVAGVGRLARVERAVHRARQVDGDRAAAGLAGVVDGVDAVAAGQAVGDARLAGEDVVRRGADHVLDVEHAVRASVAGRGAGGQIDHDGATDDVVVDGVDAEAAVEGIAAEGIAGDEGIVVGAAAEADAVR